MLGVIEETSHLEPSPETEPPARLPPTEIIDLHLKCIGLKLKIATPAENDLSSYRLLVRKELRATLT